MKTFHVIGLLGMLLGLAGCGTTPTSVVQQPTTARPLPPPALAPNNGAIIQPTAFRPLFEDRSARMVGDTLTIVITEKLRPASRLLPTRRKRARLIRRSATSRACRSKRCKAWA